MNAQLGSKNNDLAKAGPAGMVCWNGTAGMVWLVLSIVTGIELETFPLKNNALMIEAT